MLCSGYRNFLKNIYSLGYSTINSRKEHNNFVKSAYFFTILTFTSLFIQKTDIERSIIKLFVVLTKL